MHGLIKQIPIDRPQWQVSRPPNGIEAYNISVGGLNVFMKVWHELRAHTDYKGACWIDGALMFETTDIGAPTVMAECEQWLESVAKSYEIELARELATKGIADLGPSPDVMPHCALCGSPVDVRPHVSGEFVICASCRAEVS